MIGATMLTTMALGAQKPRATEAARADPLPSANDGRAATAGAKPGARPAMNHGPKRAAMPMNHVATRIGLAKNVSERNAEFASSFATVQMSGGRARTDRAGQWAHWVVRLSEIFKRSSVGLM